MTNIVTYDCWNKIFYYKILVHISIKPLNILQLSLFQLAVSTLIWDNLNHHCMTTFSKDLYLSFLTITVKQLTIWCFPELIKTVIKIDHVKGSKFCKWRLRLFLKKKYYNTRHDVIVFLEISVKCSVVCKTNSPVKTIYGQFCQKIQRN